MIHRTGGKKIAFETKTGKDITGQMLNAHGSQVE